jgi:hypothetical protein
VLRREGAPVVQNRNGIDPLDLEHCRHMLELHCTILTDCIYPPLDLFFCIQTITESLDSYFSIDWALLLCYRSDMAVLQKW